MYDRTYLFIFFLQWRCVCLLTISDTIKNDTHFYYRKLSNYPSKLATIGYSVTFNYNVKGKVRMDFYTTEDHINIQNQCRVKVYEQVRNDNLHTLLRPGRYRFTTCERDRNDSVIVHCNGNTTIQDYIPRNFSFSFGFRCDLSNLKTLKGLTYSISIYAQSNKTKCSEMDSLNIGRGFWCSKFYTHATFPNMVGDPTWNDAKIWPVLMTPWGGMMVSEKSKELCYQHFYEIICYIYIPECDVSSNQLIVPCKEMCTEFVEACSDDFIRYVPLLKPLYIKQFNLSKIFNCDYLPSYRKFPCIYKRVTCEDPPNITNGVVLSKLRTNETYPVHSQVGYICKNGKYQMKGDNTSTCLHSGQWSKPPTCRNESPVSPLPLILPLLIISFTVFNNSSYCVQM